MNRLNQKIAEILKQHPEGEDFFDALDLMLRGDADILSQFYKFAMDRVHYTSERTLILTGQFGIALMSIYGSTLKEKFGNVILVNGGIRTGAEPVIFNENFSPKCIMFDDSFYSGKTRNTIEAKLKTIHSGAIIERTLVIYDGAVNIHADVYSMFRYHPIGCL
jgi:hypothetical protein